MRAVLVLLALAGFAVAAPTVRWIDKTGGFRADAVQRVIEETATSIKVELEPAQAEEEGEQPQKPRVLTIPLTRLLELIRENDQDEEQGRLLVARTAVAAGVDLKAASATLDLLSERAREKWVREYAAAYRAIAERRLGGEDVLERTTAFLRAYPKSRFVCAVIRARAWSESLPITDRLQMMQPFGDAFREIGKRGGPYLAQYGCIRDSAERNSRAHAIEMDGLQKSLESTVAEERPNATAPELTVRLSTTAEWRILVAGIKWREAHAAGVPTEVFLGRLDQIEDSADLLLPDTVVELRMEQGAVAAIEKRFEDAQRYYELAAKQDASRAHRLLLRRARDQLADSRKKR